MTEGSFKAKVFGALNGFSITKKSVKTFEIVNRKTTFEPVC